VYKTAKNSWRPIAGVSYHPHAATVASQQQLGGVLMGRFVAAMYICSQFTGSSGEQLKGNTPIVSAAQCGRSSYSSDEKPKIFELLSCENGLPKLGMQPSARTRSRTLRQATGSFHTVFLQKSTSTCLALRSRRYRNSGSRRRCQRPVLVKM